MAKTKIEWAEKVWNPVRGCSLVSEGCRNCYAMRHAHRFNGAGLPYEGLTEMGPNGPRWNGRIRLVEENLGEPLRYKRPTRWFVNSMGDLFHPEVDALYIARVFNVMAAAPQHTFLVLTKRPARMADFVTEWVKLNGCKPLKNVWLGVSVENQAAADERIPLLLQTPAAVRWLSCEPLLGPVDILSKPGPEPFEPIDWVVAGGESGPGARPCNVGWLRSLVGQCKDTGVPVFVKQLGANPEGDAPPPQVDTGTGRRTITVQQTVTIRNRKGADMREWPEDLQVREYPRHV